MTTDPLHTTQHYADTLLRDVGIVARAQCIPAHPALRAAQCGLLALTGSAGAAPQLCPLPLAACADGAIAALQAISATPELMALDGAALLGERAASFGYARAGAVSAGGSCRLLPARDGWLAINLARDSDWELIPAWLETGSLRDWPLIAAALQHKPVDAVIARGRSLGLAVGAMTPAPGDQPSWVTRQRIARKDPTAPARNKTPLVIDLSSLWAGPLCGHLLQMAGARVIKVESIERPDGARFGAKNFFDLLNTNKECVALALTSRTGREQLRQLLLRADIVIEASRPRALRQMHIVAEEIIAQNPGLTWLSITGYGRGEPQENWIAFGDDAGVAAGLSQLLFDVASEPLFCGDAIADPLTGMHAALAALASHRCGGGELLSLPLHDVVAHCIHFGAACDALSARERYRDWTDALRRSRELVAAPSVRKPAGAARALGADTDAILSEFEIVC